MKNKRLLTLFIVLVFVVLLVVLNSTVFTVKSVQIILDQTKETAGVDVAGNKILEEDKIASQVLADIKGANIFFLSEKSVRESAEKNPYINFINVERLFPNAVKVQVAERKELFCVQYGDKYYMLDREGKVLSEKAANENNIDKKSNIEVFGLSVLSAPIVGKVISADKLDFLKDFATYFYEIRYESANIRLDFIKTLTFDGDDLKVQTLRNRADYVTAKESHLITIKNFAIDLKDKFASAWAVHILQENLSDLNGKITVENTKQDGKYVAQYSQG